MEQQVKEFGSLIELLDDLDAKGIQGQRRKEIVFAYLGDRAKAKERPVVASFELTPFCNFDCKMCYVHLNKEQVGQRSLLTVAQWKRIIDLSVEAGVMASDVTGRECLTYPGFKDVYLHLLKLGIQPCVLTNGSLLSDEMVQFFSQHPPKLIQISVYGSDTSAYQKVTGRAAFDDVMAGIERLKKAKIPTHLILTPSRYMQDDASKLLDHLRSLGLPYSIGGISLSARPETQRQLVDYEIEVDCFARLQKNEIEYRNSYALSQERRDLYPLKMHVTSNLEGAPCGAAHNHFHVNWKGEMTPCISFYSVTSSILEKGFQTAWNEIREKMKEFRMPAECALCEYQQECSSCPAEKCYGRPGESLNSGVCRRMRAYDKMGLLGKTI